MRPFTPNEKKIVEANGSIMYYQSMKPWWVTLLVDDHLVITPWWANSKDDVFNCLTGDVISVAIIK